MDDFCKKHNIKRTEFLERALNHFVNSIENDLNLLSLAYYSVSDCNWLRLAVDDFLYDLWDSYYQDEDIEPDKILEEENVKWHEYPEMIEKYGFEKVVSILIKFISAENNLRFKRHRLL